MKVKKGDLLIHKTEHKVAFVRARGLSISEFDHSWDSAVHGIDAHADLNDWRRVEDFERLRTLVFRLADDLFDRNTSDWTLDDVEGAIDCPMYSPEHSRRHSRGEKCPACEAGAEAFNSKGVPFEPIRFDTNIAGT